MKIAVFARHSLFTDGITSQLLARPAMFETHFVDAGDINAFRKITEISPSIILVEAMGECISKKNMIARLLDTLPQSVILQLDYDSAFVKIFSSEQRQAHQFGDLVAIIKDLTPYVEKDNQCLESSFL